ncbi:MAG: M20/M25/M40 family metallo-hydrolase [Acidobacteriota bacterium]
MERLPEEVFARTKRLLVDLCAISSASAEPEGLRAMASRLADELQARGLRTEIDDADGAPVLVARGPDTANGHLLVVGHMDTVLPAIPPVLDGDRLLATGALDMKGGLAAFIGALDLLAGRGESWPRDLLLVVVSDEEVSGVVSEAAVRRWSERARAVLVIEPGEAAGDGETLVAGRRGLFEWRLEATGQASHSGLAYWQGRSAVAAVAEWSVRAQSLAEPGIGPTVNVARVLGGTAEFVDDPAQRQAMLGTSRQRNVVPDRAVAEGEARFLSAEDGERVRRSLETLTVEVGAERAVTMRFEVGLRVPPVDSRGANAEMVRRTVELAAKRGLRLSVEEDRGGISFPNYLADPGRVPVIDGLGPVGVGMHTREEALDLRSLARRIVLLADLLATL